MRSRLVTFVSRVPRYQWWQYPGQNPDTPVATFDHYSTPGERSGHPHNYLNTAFDFSNERPPKSGYAMRFVADSIDRNGAAAQADLGGKSWDWEVATANSDTTLISGTMTLPAASAGTDVLRIGDRTSPYWLPSAYAVDPFPPLLPAGRLDGLNLEGALLRLFPSGAATGSRLQRWCSAVDEAAALGVFGADLTESAARELTLDLADGEGLYPGMTAEFENVRYTVRTLRYLRGSVRAELARSAS